jgi:O-antigen/teichoic acid export membrane protein
VLDVLGVEDYGIYAVVGGIVSLFSFLSGSVASATQRFFSFAIGENNQDKLNKTFSMNALLYLVIVIIATFLLETVGLWFVKYRLQVPPERIQIVIIVFHYSVITFVFSILSAPFIAIIIAHEDMQYYAYISIVEAFLKLGVIFLLAAISLDKLQLYAMLVAVVSILNMLIYFFVCLGKYKECQIRKFHWDKSQFRDIVDFTGWTLFGQLTSVSRNQAITILINQAFSPITVAARAIATQVTSNINLFSNNFNVGLYPPIIKAYASGRKDEMRKLIYNGSKMTFFLMWIIALPIFVELELIFDLWLKDTPNEAILFTRLAIIEAMISSISLPIATAGRAPGRMRYYELTLGLLQVLLFGLAWLAIILGSPAYGVYIIAIIVNVIMFFVRIVIVDKLVGISIKQFYKDSIKPIVIIMILSTLFTYLLYLNFDDSMVVSISNLLIITIVNCILMFYFGLTRELKYKVIIAIKTRLKF